MNICPPTFLLGVWLMRYQSFIGVNIAIICGLVFLAVFSIMQGIIGTQTGLPTYPLSRLAFGDFGSRLFSLIMFLTLIGWFGVMTESMVVTFYTQIFPAAGIEIGNYMKAPISFLFGMAITGICFFGFQAIAWLNRITIPGLVFLAFFALLQVLRRPDLMDRVVTWQPSETPVSIYTVMIWFVGSLIVAAVTAPDFNRYCRQPKDTIYSVLLGNVPVVYFLTVMGMVFAILSGAADGHNSMEAADLASVFAAQGWNLGPLPGSIIAVLILVGAIITTNVVNLYPSAMALVVVIKGAGKYWKYFEDRAVLTIFVGILGSLAAAAGVLTRFTDFLEMLTHFTAPLIGIMSTDYFVLNNRDRIKGLINISAVLIWLLFSVAAIMGILPGGGMAAVFYAGLVYYGLEKTLGKKLHAGQTDKLLPLKV